MLVKTFEELKLTGNLPSPSGVGMRVLEITRREDFSTSDLGNTIRADSSLTGRILKLANCASRAGVEPATTVSDSIMRLGTRTVRDLALAFSLVSNNRKGTNPGFDYDLYWGKSLARAVCAQELCRGLQTGKPEEAYICGLLSDIGQLALASVYPESYSELWVKYGSEGAMDSLRDLEQETFDIHHGQVAVFLLHEWGLPDVFAEAVESFTQDRSLAGKQGQADDLSGVLRLAEVLSGLFIGREGSDCERRSVVQQDLELVREGLALDPQEFDAFLERCFSEWADWGEALGVDTERVIRERSQAPTPDPVPVISPEPEQLDELDEPTEPAPMEQPVSEVSTTTRILAVDDDPVSLRVLVRHLERGGYEVIKASNGRQALRVALEQAPDIVISDWVMPELDGLEFCRELRRIDSGRKMYFLLVTGRGEEERVVEAFDAGVDDYVTKPFVPRVLSARIKGARRLVHLQRQVQADKTTMMRQVAELGKMTRKLRAAALTDPLTQLHNRRYAMKRLESEWSSIERTGRPLTVIMIDIDNFKAVNDTHGHDVGDIVLVATSNVLLRSIRKADDVCRMGGEEFLVICKGADQAAGVLVAERIRSAVESHVIDHPGFERSVTLSLGVATAGGADDSISALLKRADEAVYEAKSGGRNRVCEALLGARRKTA